MKSDIPEFAELSREAKADHSRKVAHYKQELLQYEHRYCSSETKDDGFIVVPSVESGAAAETVPPVGANSGYTPVAAQNPAAMSTVDATMQPVDPAQTGGPAQIPLPIGTQPPATAPQKASPPSESSMAHFAKPPPPEAPMPPNDLVPYKDNLFGMDKARRDCRFEMIKIVREVRVSGPTCFPWHSTDDDLQVDAVAENPKVACDPDRAWQYLSPAVFRMLLPVCATILVLT